MCWTSKWLSNPSYSGHFTDYCFDIPFATSWLSTLNHLPTIICLGRMPEKSTHVCFTHVRTALAYSHSVSALTVVLCFRIPCVFVRNTRKMHIFVFPNVFCGTSSTYRRSGSRTTSILSLVHFMCLPVYPCVRCFARTKSEMMLLDWIGSKPNLVLAREQLG